MLVLVMRRILQAIPTIVGISLITFLVVRLSGDPALMVLGDLATPEALARYREEHGLDRPVAVQYATYMRSVLAGDLGVSLRSGQPVAGMFLSRIPATLELVAAAVLLSAIFGVALGIVSALNHGTAVDLIIRTLALLGQAIPGFFLGIVLILVFSVYLQWLPTGGRGGIQHTVLPTITLAAFMVALISRFTRTSLIEVLKQDYVRTARAKGVGRSGVVLRHAMKNSLIPVITVIGLQSAAVVSGAIVTETVFSWPGVGRFIVQGVYGRDYPVIQAAVMFVTIGVVVVNLLVDIVYGIVDPRVRYG